MPGAARALRATGLRKTYGKRTVVHDVSLSVAGGEVVGLLGPNGAGKTTSFYMIVGIVPTDAGRIEINDAPITNMPIHKRARLGLSYLPQDASVFRRLTVEQNIQAVLELHRDAHGHALSRAQIQQHLASLLDELQISHIRRNRQARGEALPDDILQTPLMYQGISHGFMAWHEAVRLPDENLGIDFEAEIAAITDDVPMGVSAEDAPGHIKLFVLLNDISLRALIPKELKRTFGFLTGKPASSLGPIAVTPDELDELWDGQLVSGTLHCYVRGELFGTLQTGMDTPFHYGRLIAHAARTRKLEPGTLIGLGTVSNENEQAGFGCIAERRAVETINTGQAATPFLKFGDTLHIEHFDHMGQSVFGAIAQRVEPLA